LKPRIDLPWLLLLAVLIRLPFWAEALRTPLDGDTAIIGLMARHPGRGTTMWGQPYGSPLEPWLAAPFVGAFGATAEALRLFYFVVGLALVPVAYLLAGRLHGLAARPAAVLMALPPPYLLLMSSLPPPLYPTTLVLCGALLALAVALGERLAEGASPRTGLVFWGLLSGLALWTHLMSASVVAACGAFLWTRARGRRGVLAVALVPLLAASAPWWLRLVGDRWATHAVSLSDRDETLAAHLGQVLPSLHVPIGGLLGTHVPVVADAAEGMVHAPGWAAGGLVLVYGVLLVLAVRERRRSAGAGLLLGAAVLTLLAFPFPLRSGPHTIRFLTPAYLCAAALVAWVPLARAGAGADEGRRAVRRSWIVVLALACLHLVGGMRLLAAWRGLDRAAPPFSLPDLEPLREFLAESGIRRAYASYGPAYRLTYESGERLVVSQPWNERFRHYPLPYLDEVRFAKDVAWLLTPAIPTDLPAPKAFEDALGQAGGSWRRTTVGPATVYHDFVPPFAASVEPFPGAEQAGDGRLETRRSQSGDAPVTFTLPAPRSLDGVTMVTAPDGPPLLRSMNVEVSADGTGFEIVARRRRRDERKDLRWVNGHPQYVIDHDLIAVPLHGRTVAALRIHPYASDEAWQVAEILLHPAQDPARRAPWDEWLDPNLDWAGRREALATQPRPDREDWYWRALLAARNR
jgi:4-amino-4-deoxy-L-arabinose transferase-like glycosyltransferase